MTQQKNPLHLFLKRVADGDKSAHLKLTEKLADKLVYVPTAAPGLGPKARIEKVQVLRIHKNGSSVVPVFTSSKLYRDWVVKDSHKGDSISLLCADLAIAVQSEGGSTSFLIDLGSEHEAVLDSSIVKSLSETSPEEAIETSEIKKKDDLEPKTSGRVILRDEPSVSTAVRRAPLEMISDAENPIRKKEVEGPHEMPPQEAKKGFFGAIRSVLGSH